MKWLFFWFVLFIFRRMFIVYVSLNKIHHIWIWDKQSLFLSDVDLNFVFLFNFILVFIAFFHIPGRPQNSKLFKVQTFKFNRHVYDFFLFYYGYVSWTYLF